MITPTPPPDFQSWLDYAVATLGTRWAYLGRDHCDDNRPSHDDVRTAAQEELDHLKAMAHLPGYRMLQDWRGALSKRLGRTAEAIIEDGLGAADFSADSVRVQFEDGTDLTFRRAFYVGETPADGAVHRVAVFTEHCGYHEFWIGPDDRIEAVSFQGKIEHGPDLKGMDGISLESSEHSRFVDDIRQAQSEIGQGLVSSYEFRPVSEQDVAWDNMVPIGREFGSPDFERLLEEDAKKFASDLTRWIQQSSALYSGLHLEEAETSDARNVQLALYELGQDVTLNVAASVWKHYSQSIMAGWMAGAETVAGAFRTLYSNCPRDQST
jgi:hypothetical protein